MEKDKLNNLIKEGQEIINMGLDSTNPEFSAWRTKVLILLQKIYGNNSIQYNSIKNRKFRISSYIWGTDMTQKQITYFKDSMEASLLELRSYYDDISENYSDNEQKPKSVEGYNNKIFIVHGRDNESKISVARFVEKIKLDAIILNESPGKGNTIIEKIEDNSDVGYAIIIYSPCDEGRLKNEVGLSNRARQNVVFEHGYFCAKIGRDRVAALVKGDVETPSDISGIEYIPMDNSNAWMYKIGNELKAAGYRISLDDI